MEKPHLDMEPQSEPSLRPQSFCRMPCQSTVSRNACQTVTFVTHSTDCNCSMASNALDKLRLAKGKQEFEARMNEADEIRSEELEVQRRKIKKAKKKKRSCKIIIVGDSGTGKTCLISRFVYQIFDEMVTPLLLNCTLYPAFAS